MLLGYVYRHSSCELRGTGQVVIEQGWRVKWLLAQCATRLPFRLQTLYFDYHKVQGDRDGLRKHKHTCCKSIRECGEDWFGLKVISSR